ncbi:MAG TPA: carboxylesterase family protein [Polyangiaceae bacterium]|nr:carboxylesterase family protein [Polyangiaceae bacterium]
MQLCRKRGGFRSGSALATSKALNVAAVLGALAGAGTVMACGATPPISSGTGGTGGTSACNAAITQGALLGKAVGSTCEFLGIPYAAPPVGALRFAPPKPAAGWSGVRTATALGPWCIQGPPPPPGSVQSEDCLVLDVYTPKTAPTKRLPVMVFIHGAGLASSMHDAQALSERGAVVVVINYRPGPLGFLALPELDAQRPGVPSGSDAIRDQQLALAWVKKNVAKFHGNPSNVTVFGESAGALSACIHLVSPGSQGLAQRYILQSGHCIDGAVITRDRAYAAGAEFVKTFCPGAADPLACLRAADPVALMTWTPPPSVTNGLGGAFGPVIEGSGGVLPDAPLALISRGAYDRAAAIMSGTTVNEWGRFSMYTPVPTVAAFNATMDALFGARAAEAKAVYPVTSDAEAQSVADALMNDNIYRCRERTLLRSLRAHGTENVFLYSYEVGRAWHADDLLGLFKMDTGLLSTFFAGSTLPSPAFQALMQNYWVRFAASGDPNGGSAPSWPKYSADSSEYLALRDPTPTASANLRSAQCDFWDSFWAEQPGVP